MHGLSRLMLRIVLSTERRGDAFEMDNDFDTENAKFKATARYSFGWSDPRGLYGSADCLMINLLLYVRLHKL